MRLLTICTFKVMYYFSIKLKKKIVHNHFAFLMVPAVFVHRLLAYQKQWSDVNFKI